MAHDAIQAIKQLRRDVVEAMRSLMKLAKRKQTSGMLPICEDMITKTRILLSLWDPGLVEEALTFLEEHKVAKVQEETTNEEGSLLDFKVNQSLSPFKRITQQLNFDLKSPDFDDFVTPDTPECMQDTWCDENAKNNYASLTFRNSMNCDNIENTTATSTTGTTTVTTPASTTSTTTTTTTTNATTGTTIATTTSTTTQEDENKEDFVIFPEVENDQDVKGTEAKENGNHEVSNNNDDDEERYYDVKKDTDKGKRFLDMKKMCNSPSANYYKPTDEPEPWDLTQLNIEASVMCLVSKVKFLCGRCSSPAVRLRNKNSLGRSQSLKGCLSNNRNNPSVVTIQPKNALQSEESSKLLENSHNSVSRHEPSPGLDKSTPAFSKAKEGKEINLTTLTLIPSFRI